jgi:aspartyl-tRNA(Asn)/glutamyl-tRNA(Gln) amidotransferase subunit A
VQQGGRDLPVGLQLVGPHFAESLLLSVSHQYQQLTDWHKRLPTEYA